MAKEFDIFLNKRLTECDILVYSIPYRDGLTAIHKLILESCIENYTLQKFIAVQTGSELVHHIDEMIKTCYERLNFATRLDVSASFQTHYTLYSDEAEVVLSADCIKTLSNMFAGVESALQLDVQPITAFTGKSGGNAEAAVVLDSVLEKEVKNSLLTIINPIDMDAVVIGTNKTGLLSVDAALPIHSDITNLCYRFYTGGQAVIQFAADVLETELHYSLGEGTTSITLNSEVDGGDCATKYESFESLVNILSEITEAINQIMVPDEVQVILGFEAEPILKRYRLLKEMDNNSLLEYDDMELEEIDYVII